MSRRPSPARRAADHLAANPAIWALFALAALWIGWFAVQVHVYFVMPDELRYVKQAVAWGSGEPVVPGTERWTTWSLVYPLLLAPLWSTLPTGSAYYGSHVLNALVFASAAFPAYLLGRAVLRSHAWALAGAALAVVIPWTVMAGVMMTEVAAYPLSLWAVLAVHRAAVRPSLRADVVALGALLGAFAARTELIVLWGALPVVLLAQGLRYPAVAIQRRTRRLRGVLRDHWLVFALVIVVAVIAVVHVKTLLGNAPRDGPLRAGTWDYARDMLAYVSVGTGLLPLALGAGWAMATLARPADAARHAYAVILVAVGLPLTILIGGGSRALVAVGAVELGVNDRYLFYLAPLMIVGMLALLRERRPLTVATLAGGLAAAWVVWKAKLALSGPTFVTPTATWHPVLNDYAAHVGRWLGKRDLSSGEFAAGVTVLATALVALARRRAPGAVAVVVAVAVAASCLQQTLYTRDRLEKIQPGAGYADGRNWVDELLPRGQAAAALMSSLGVDSQTAQATWWDLAFWNHGVAYTRYTLGSQGAYASQAFPRRFFIFPGTGRVLGLPEHARYVVRAVADRRFGLRGATPVGEPHNNLQLWSVPQPVRAEWAALNPDDTGYLGPGQTTLLRVFSPGAAGRYRVKVPLGSAFGATRPAPYAITVRGRRRAGEVAASQVVSPEAIVRLPAIGSADLVIDALDRPGSPGVQFYGATVSAVR